MTGKDKINRFYELIININGMGASMEIRQLRTFLTIVELNSFTQAAERLGYTQPSITAQIQQLERDLGIRLFERLKKKLFLTPEGETLVEYAQQILNLCAQVKNAMDNTTFPKGVLRIGTLESLASTRLSHLFSVFHELYPQVEFILKIAGPEQFQIMLQDNQIDAAFYLDLPIDDPDLTVILSASEPMALLASINHPLASAHEISPRQIAQYPLILSESGCSYRRFLLDLLENSNLSPCSIMEIGNIQTIKQLTASGFGLTLLPKICVESELRDHRLVDLKWPGPQLVMQTQLVCHRDKWISPILKAFLEHAQKMLCNKRLPVTPE